MWKSRLAKEPVHKSIHCSLQDKVVSAVQGETQQTNAFIIYNDNPTRNVDKLTIIGKIWFLNVNHCVHRICIRRLRKTVQSVCWNKEHWKRVVNVVKSNWLRSDLTEKTEDCKEEK